MHGISKVQISGRRYQDNYKRVVKKIGKKEGGHEEGKVPNKTLLALGIRITKLNDGITTQRKHHVYYYSLYGGQQPM